MVKSFLTAFLVFFLLDMIWLGLVAKNFYRTNLAFILGDGSVNWTAAIIFYILFILGMVVFVISPALESKSWVIALSKGALFGLITYATYDLTNMATIKEWPLIVTIVDMTWGTVLASVVSVSTYFILR